MLVLPLDDPSQVFSVRVEAARLGQQACLPGTQAAKLALVATEAATNLLKHGASGCIVLGFAENDPACGIDLWAVDRGPGMADVRRCLEDGYSTAGSSGTGLGAIRRLSDSFDLYSQPGKGTVVFARIGPLERPPAFPRPAWQVGGIGLPIRGETVCGDCWGRRLGDDGVLTLLMADGLGHGPLAAEASLPAVAALAGERHDPAAVIERAHAALRATRGAAVAAVRLAAGARLITFAGVGNIAGRVCVADAGCRSFVSLPGIVGHEMRRVQTFDYALPDNAAVVLHSDGLTTSWDLAAYPGLLACHPAVVAGVLWRDHTRGRDDVTVVVAKEAA